MPTCLVIDGTATTTYSAAPCLPEARHRSAVLHEEIVRPVCEQLGLTLLRAGSLAEAGLPLDQLLHLLTEADVVVADLGGSDPELAFAFGARHALGRRTVHVAQDAECRPAPGTVLHLAFSSHPGGAATARKQLLDALEADPLRTDGPIETGSATGTESGLDENLPGMFDLIVEAETQMEALADDMADVDAAMSDLTELMLLLGEEMTQANHSGAPASKRMAVVNRLAKAIEGPTGELEAAADRFVERMRTSYTAFQVFLDWLAATPRADWPEDAEESLEQIALMDWGAELESASVQEGMTMINMLGAASRHMRRPARRITSAFRNMLHSIAMMQELHSKAVELRRS
ncbi:MULTISPECIES: hypothetical protein [Streptomyces]|uniref:hypothetical protein n=1 Tax=Streptomyces TaxID=1883 RepID=UPI000241A0E6|nr:MULTISPECIES: hypothetical protein [Streptomyces]EHM27213.1 hypothetical protein SPW_4355 [Streptomyces sp. W007]WTD29235.1 hypothetical protein OH737_34025 [Streptomyces anulatus]